MIVKVLKSPSSGRPVARIEACYDMSGYRARIRYTLNARYALTIGCTDTVQTVDTHIKCGATKVAPSLLNYSYKVIRESLTALHHIDIDRVTRCTVNKSTFGGYYETYFG